MDYREQIAERAYGLYKQGKSFLKVYAIVEKDGKYVVLHRKNKNNKDEYRLAGGGVDDGEDNVTAIKRELIEELNMNVEIIKSLGSYKYPTKREYQGKEFKLDCYAEIFYVKFLSYADNNKMGIEGEFDNLGVDIAYITRSKLLKSFDIFTKHGFVLDN